MGDLFGALCKQMISNSGQLAAHCFELDINSGKIAVQSGKMVTSGNYFTAFSGIYTTIYGDAGAFSSQAKAVGIYGNCK